MSTITAKEVNELRTRTGAGMMDCKKALTEAEGDFEKAIELLRKKGQKVSDSRSDRDAKEGSVFARTTENGTKGYMIELNCETDFVAKNDEFQAFGNSIIEAVTAAGASDPETAKTLSINGKSIADHLIDYMGKIGEKIDIRKCKEVQAQQVIAYIHPGARLGVLVGFNNTDGVDTATVGKDVAMQIAAMSPIAIDRDGVDANTVEKEIEIGKEQARLEGKPEAMLEKIALGKLNKFYKENTLLEQDFVKDSSKSIGQYLKEVKPELSVIRFERVQLGN
jgi:elongation factor Ts